MDASESKLAELERMALQGQVAEALARTSGLVHELEATGGDERLLARARCSEGALLNASGRAEEALATWRGVVAAHGRSSDQAIRRVAAAAQHNLANEHACLGDMVAAEKAMDELVAQ